MEGILNILVMDENHADSISLRRILGEGGLGHRIWIAKSAKEAADLIARSHSEVWCLLEQMKPIQVVFVAMSIGDIEGARLKTAITMKSKEEWQIFVVGMMDSWECEMLHRFDIDWRLRKPVQLEDVKPILSEILKRVSRDNPPVGVERL